jgi:hypothetical protein
MSSEEGLRRHVAMLSQPDRVLDVVRAAAGSI